MVGMDIPITLIGGPFDGRAVRVAPTISRIDVPGVDGRYVRRIGSSIFVFIPGSAPVHDRVQQVTPDRWTKKKRPNPFTPAHLRG